MLADSQTELDASQLLIDRAGAAQGQRSGRVHREASVAKLSRRRPATALLPGRGRSTVAAAMSMNAASSSSTATRGDTIYEGTSEIQRHVIAREVLRRVARCLGV